MGCRIAVLLVLCFCAYVSNAETVASIYDWTESPDYAQLRHKLGWDNNFRSFCESRRPGQAMVDAMNNEQWDSAANQGLKWLNNCPVDILIHYYTGIALTELGREQEGQDHFRWAEGLMDSIVASGDGESPETAYVTISVNEEYDALYFFGLTKKSQALVSGSIMCDLITGVNDEGKEISIYFNPKAHFARLRKLLDMSD